MTPTRKTHHSPGEENPTAESELQHAADPAQQQAEAAKQSGGDQGQGGSKQYDWREQSEPHAIEYPARMPPSEAQEQVAPPAAHVEPAQPAPKAALPGAPYAAGTPITITPYTAAGHPTIWVMGNEQLGAEFALLMSVKNQVHFPPLKT